VVTLDRVDERWMADALAEAHAAAAHDDVPIGAVLVHDGQIVARGHNRREVDVDPTAHAELIALREGARALGTWRLDDCTLYVTLEPCTMCAGALVLARLGRLVFGADDPKAGAVGRSTTYPATLASTTGSRSCAASRRRPAARYCVSSSAPAAPERLAPPERIREPPNGPSALARAPRRRHADPVDPYQRDPHDAMREVPT
jgi:tRNA(adenine34) deaminase